MTNFTNYKSKIASRYIPVDAEQIGLKIAESEYYLSSVKYDGHLAFLKIIKGKAQLFDRNGKELKITSVTDASKVIKDDVVLAGELCCFLNDKIATHREVNSALAKPDKYDIRFAAFDLLEIKGEAPPSDPKERMQILTKLLNKGKEVFAIEQHCFESRKEIIDFFNTVSEQKTEGVIVKLPSGITYKVKKVHTLDLVVLGYAESVGEREGLLRELLLGFALGNNKFQIVSKCGGGFSDKERKEFPKQLEKLAIESEYTEVSSAKTAFIFVKPEMVVEISCLDLINENSDGPIKKAMLSYNYKKGFDYLGNQNTLSIISPNFIQIRSDKNVNEKESGSAQAYSITEPILQAITNEKIIDSKIIIRELFTKGGKGGTAIRKFVGIKTNKEDTGLFSPFVVVFTDFSAGRKTPLEQEIFLCNSEKEVKNKIEQLKEDNIKKGWEAYN